MSAGVRVWDWPIRLFHWLSVIALGVSWWSAENGRMDLHYQSGLFLVLMIAFRLVLGFIGGSTSRFSNFVKSPSTVLAQLKGEALNPTPGHSPLAGYSVIAMLLSMVVQVGSGLFATDIDGLESGPLSFLVSFDTGRIAADVHEISFNILLALVSLHILAIFFYLVVRRRNLLTSMITGRDRQLDPLLGDATSSGKMRIFLSLAIAVLLTWSVSNGFWL
jgi:cytochrome b